MYTGVALTSRVFGAYYKRLSAGTQKALAAASVVAGDAITNMIAVKSSSKEYVEVNRYKVFLLKMDQRTLRVGHAMCIFFTLALIFCLLSLFLSFVVSLFGCARGPRPAVSPLFLLLSLFSLSLSLPPPDFFF